MLGLVKECKSTGLAECLIEAKCLIEQGWNKHRFVSTVKGKVAYCALGAIYSASEDAFIYKKALRKFVQLNKLEEIPLSDEMRITLWNDSPCRTKEEVLKAFDRVIENES